MSEAVVITPRSGIDANDDPLPAGDPVTLRGLVAPGNTLIKPGADSDLDVVDFIVYLPLMVSRPTGWVRTSTLLTENFTITIRDQVCVGRVKVWDENGRGGVEVLASAKSGATP
ncbi:MAG TPA: hypothetical protein PLH92_17045 [Mycobacterium sp.]|nr:hypothetical protein [Mycobacterium sp.]